MCDLEEELSESALDEVRQEWACAKTSPTKYLAFEKPPPTVPLVPKERLPEFAWSAYDEIEGKPSLDIVKELIRRSLEVACYRAGLVWCDDREVLYFPHLNGPQRNAKYRHVDGRRTYVAVTGERTYGQGVRATPFRYQLCPNFRVGRDEAGDWWVTTRVYVRVTDCQGTPFQKKDVIRRRKAVTKAWWNKEWFARTLGVMQELSGGASEIKVGAGRRELSVSTVPLVWACPVSIDVEAVERVGDFQEEMSAMRYIEDEEDTVLPDGEETGPDE